MLAPLNKWLSQWFSFERIIIRVVCVVFFCLVFFWFGVPAEISNCWKRLQIWLKGQYFVCFKYITTCQGTLQKIFKWQLSGLTSSEVLLWPFCFFMSFFFVAISNQVPYYWAYKNYYREGEGNLLFKLIILPHTWSRLLLIINASKKDKGFFKVYTYLYTWILSFTLLCEI